MEYLENEEWDRLIRGLREGDHQVCEDFWNKIGPLLQGVAQKQLSEHVQKRVGSGDVVQSACRTFFRRVSSGQFDLPHAEALWQLMCAITLTKARQVASDHPHLKSDSSDESVADTSGGNASPSKIQTALDVAEFSEQLDNVLSHLSPPECQVLDLKLQNHTNDEIAKAMNCSERTIKRLENQIHERWGKLFDD